MNINEYNKKVRAAVASDMAPGRTRDVSDRGQTTTPMTVVGADGKKIVLRLYGR